VGEYTREDLLKPLAYQENSDSLMMDSRCVSSRDSPGVHEEERW
jgi:hypothetical protein